MEQKIQGISATTNISKFPYWIWTRVKNQKHKKYMNEWNAAAAYNKLIEYNIFKWYIITLLNIYKYMYGMLGNIWNWKDIDGYG